jgi:hypothetical protein
MAIQAPVTPPTTPAPPPLPNMPQVGPVATDYLRRFSLWAQTALNSKQPLGQAQTGIMLVANNAPAGVTPNVFLLQVNQQGNFVGTPVPLGQGKP